ncbi:hypothetical protein SLEP1_g24460 [Rubroshorea leprosula]|uniref:Uncharacterized protein n=1 Tax=Rubroshorea leprosula TaxID=152421 RepID=A0AAV5JQ68_9ROSI|nr:hypothetical protein SLEP1_g24460 [Rubroshorea leprosula]
MTSGGWVNPLPCKRFKAILANVVCFSRCVLGAGLLGNSVAPYLSESLVVKFHFFHLELHGLFMWLICLYWLSKSSDHSIEIVVFCEDWQAVIKLNSLVLPISTFLIPEIA